MDRSRNVQPYMLARGPETPATESYVSSPPALWVIDEAGNTWTLGFSQGLGPQGELAFSVLRNGLPTGEIASRIERRGGKIRIFTRKGWKKWTGSVFF